MLSRRGAEKAERLSKGQRVMVHGQVEGLMMNVLLRKCDVV
jgi:hypothetical protein